MDDIESLLEQLLDNTPERYKGIAENALDIYQRTGGLTVKLHTWALKTAQVQAVTIPDGFHELKVFEPRSAGGSGYEFGAPLAGPSPPTSVLSQSCPTSTGSLPVPVQEGIPMEAARGRLLAEALVGAAEALLLVAKRFRQD